MASLLLAAGFLHGGDADKDLKKLQGKWLAVALEMNGAPKKADQVARAKITLIVKDKDYTLITNNGTQKGIVVLDPSKKPAEFDFIYPDPKGEKGEKLLIKSIYEWDGEL